MKIHQWMMFAALALSGCGSGDDGLKFEAHITASEYFDSATSRYWRTYHVVVKAKGREFKKDCDSSQDAIESLTAELNRLPTYK